MGAGGLGVWAGGGALGGFELGLGGGLARGFSGGGLRLLALGGGGVAGWGCQRCQMCGSNISHVPGCEFGPFAAATMAPAASRCAAFNTRQRQSPSPRSATFIALCQLFATAGLLRFLGVPLALCCGPTVAMTGLVLIALEVRGAGGASGVCDPAAPARTRCQACRPQEHARGLRAPAEGWAYDGGQTPPPRLPRLPPPKRQPRPATVAAVEVVRKVVGYAITRPAREVRAGGGWGLLARLAGGGVGRRQGGWLPSRPGHGGACARRFWGARTGRRLQAGSQLAGPPGFL